MREDTKIPQFKSLEEEREYWEERGPLAQGHKGRVNRPKPGQKRSSFLAVRLTGEELTRLRDIAANQGLGTSTFARLILTSAIEHQSQLKTMTLGQLKDVLENLLPQSAKERADNLWKKTAIGDPGNPAMLIIDANQQKAYEELTLLLLKAYMLAGAQLIIPDKENYQKLKEVVKAQT